MVNRKAQVASVLITTAVLTAWMLFWGYGEATAQALAGRVVVPQEPADLILDAPDDSIFAEFREASRAGAFRSLPVESAYGRLQLGAITFVGKSQLLPDADDGEVWLSDELAERWQLGSGDSFPLRFLQSNRFLNLSAQVAGSFPHSSFFTDVFVDAGWLLQRGVQLPEQSRLFYDRLADGGTWDSTVQYLTRTATRVRSHDVIVQARRVVAGTLSSGSSAIALLFTLMVLGVGTFTMLSYMDTRKELAILKSMGLRPREASAVFWLESAISVIAGWLLAVIASKMLVGRFPFAMMLTTSVYRRSLLGLVAALFAATIIPSLLGEKAGVLELMFNRPVPIWRTKHKELTRRHAALEEKVAAGYRVVKLPVPDGQFDGICLRQAGQAVKENETLAWESHTWGMGERHYLAPCDGVVVECDLGSGVLVIAPE